MQVSPGGGPARSNFVDEARSIFFADARSVCPPPPPSPVDGSELPEHAANKRAKHPPRMRRMLTQPAPYDRAKCWLARQHATIVSPFSCRLCTTMKMPMPRVALALIATLIGCSSDSKPVIGVDMAARNDSAVCIGDLAFTSQAPVPCGPLICPAGKICMIFTPGVAPFDGGPGDSYSCEDLPTACSCAPGCGAQASSSGCFSELCQGEPECSFDGSTLTCYGI